MTRKGMSQTLALIVAASVLMMTALTVIFMVQGGLTDTFEGSQRQSCISTIETKCSVSGGEVRAPSSCQDVTFNGMRLDSNTEYECTQLGLGQN